MQSLQTQICNEPMDYTGRELSAHWIYLQTGLVGNALISFIGATQVPLDHMVDLEDVQKKAPIYSPKMLHFVGEWFIDSMKEGILYQHLLVNEFYELLLEKGIQGLSRTGNDVYLHNRKMSVSVATKSNVSVLVHLGINIQTAGTPIPTSGLEELQIEPEAFSAAILERFRRDFSIWERARVKVAPR